MYYPFATPQPQDTDDSGDDNNSWSPAAVGPSPAAASVWCIPGNDSTLIYSYRNNTPKWGKLKATPKSLLFVAIFFGGSCKTKDDTKIHRNRALVYEERPTESVCPHLWTPENSRGQRNALASAVGSADWTEARESCELSLHRKSQHRGEREKERTNFILSERMRFLFPSFAIINRSRRRNSTSSSSSLQSHAAEESLKVQSYLFIPKRSIAEKREFAVHVLRMEWNRNFERILLF